MGNCSNVNCSTKSNNGSHTSLGVKPSGVCIKTVGSMSVELGDEFVGYVFKYGAPEKRSRLWFIDREVNELHKIHGYGLDGLIVDDYSGSWECDGEFIRWEGRDFDAVWKLTNIIIPCHTFGHDDVWRLGLWPD